MKIYESVTIVNSSLNEDTLNRIIGRYEELIKKQGGSLRETIRWGKRRLAYPIKKFQYGYYIIFEFESASGLISELEHEYRLNEHILRFMTLHKDKKALLAEEQKKAQDAIQAKEAADQEAAKSPKGEIETLDDKPSPAIVPDETVTNDVTGEEHSQETSVQVPVEEIKDQAAGELASDRDNSAEVTAEEESVTDEPSEENNDSWNDPDDSEIRDEKSKE